MALPVVIAVIEGTVRANRQSEKAAKWVADFGHNLEDVEIVYIDPKEFSFPGDGRDPEARDQRYTEAVARADGFLIVTPEYNHGYPGSLKRMLDSEYDNYYHKAIALCGASDGSWGGTRVVEALLPVCKAMGLAVIRNSAYFPNVDKMFNEDGSIKEELREKYQKSVGGVYSELLWLTRALKEARDN